MVPPTPWKRPTGRWVPMSAIQRSWRGLPRPTNTMSGRAAAMRAATVSAASGL